MHKPESLRDNEMHKLPWNFDIQTDHLIDDTYLKRRTCSIIDFTVQADH